MPCVTNGPSPTGNTDHRVYLAVENQALSDDLRPSAESPLPKGVADDSHLVPTRLFFVGGEAATCRHGVIEDAEVVDGDAPAAEDFGALETGQGLAGPGQLADSVR
jgi:hypothetical protein